MPSSSSGGELEVDLTFSAIEDFEPDRLIDRIELLSEIAKRTDSDGPGSLNRHLDRILHAPEFQAVEAAWRGLWYLVSQTETSSQLQIKVLDASKSELLRDLQRAPEVDQSWFFKRVYEEPYGQFCAAPFALLIGDFAFSTNAEDIELLEKLGQIASLCHAPFVAGAAPGVLGLDDFRRLPQVRDVARVFDSTEYAKWRRFRQSEDARYVALTLPRILLRSPYGIRPGVAGEFQYAEDTRGDLHLLWGNAAFAFGACVANAFARYGWCAAIRGMEGGGLVEGLPTWIRHHEAEGDIRLSVEVALHDRREKELSDLGFIPLVQFKGTDSAVFYSVQSCCQPRQYAAEAANANSRLSCQLPYLLTSSRFMHYVKAMARDKMGSYATRGDWERYLNNWISRYVLVDDQASPAIRATRPLREARIDVSEDQGKPGRYRIVAYLRPHFQLDELSVSLRVVGYI
ncbi:MAG: type VI secretion system contractile sheath large subunit [Acidobacteriia bacterium]|nr:type VI secretion system contractile sheath large subunit [Terriglobia bacterium]